MRERLNLVSYSTETARTIRPHFDSDSPPQSPSVPLPEDEGYEAYLREEDVSQLTDHLLS